MKYKLLILGVSLGIVYGLLARLGFGQTTALASVSFLFIVPTILGMIPLMFVDANKLKSYQEVIFIPWLTIIAFFMTMFILGIEDFMCLLILAMPFFILATIGTFIYRIVLINKEKNKNKLRSIVLLPLLLAPIENLIDNPSEIYHITSELIIDVPPELIWSNIVEVKTIQQEEYHSGFFNSIGIPRPISASVSKKDIGGERIGNFEGGLRFIETITTYEENKKVAFDITIDEATVRDKVFDQHVLNGDYFSFVNATYELQLLENNQVKLSLTSAYQLNSKINFYGKFWGDLILKDFQDRLLNVIEYRCKNQT